jgi:hypothetical protein
VILALEIVEEGAFADVRGFGDVFHCDVGEAALGKELERTPEQAQARFGGTALAASHALQVGQILGSESFREFRGLNCMTVIHIRPTVIFER